jgi:hypothetical protein
MITSLSTCFAAGVASVDLCHESSPHPFTTTDPVREGRSGPIAPSSSAVGFAGDPHAATKKAAAHASAAHAMVLIVETLIIRNDLRMGGVMDADTLDASSLAVNHA